MIIDFKAQQIQSFLAVIQQLQDQPELYQFSDVAGFFKLNGVKHCLLLPIMR